MRGAGASAVTHAHDPRPPLAHHSPLGADPDTHSLQTCSTVWEMWCREEDRVLARCQRGTNTEQAMARAQAAHSRSRALAYEALFYSCELSAALAAREPQTRKRQRPDLPRCPRLEEALGRVGAPEIRLSLALAGRSRASHRALDEVGAC